MREESDENERQKEKRVNERYGYETMIEREKSQ